MPIGPILTTKLHRPSAVADLVVREHLFARLDEGRGMPLTLVCAPAGYGKTTLVAEWLERIDVPSAWVSLGPDEGDPGGMLEYVVAAVRTLFPEACEGVAALLEAGVLPTVSELSTTLTNDLDAIEEAFVLALDDYHLLPGTEVHELLDELLAHPPRGLQLIILSRFDPPLSLAAFRARHAMAEIRMTELRFNSEETTAFLERSLGDSVDRAVLDRLCISTEGWPLGVRLAAVAARSLGEAAELAGAFDGALGHVQDWLVEEILARQDPGFRAGLLKLAVLERFCAPLCTAVLDPEGIDGHDFLTALKATGLPCVPLDAGRKWYRLHHLVRELLQRALEQAVSNDQLKALHLSAAEWFRSEDLIEEAVEHTLLAGEEARAARLVADGRHKLAAGEEWHRIQRLTGMLPRLAIERNVELALAEAWSRYCFYPPGELDRVLVSVDLLLDESDLDDDLRRRLRGEVESLRGFELFQRGDGEKALACCNRALELLPEECISERGFTLIMQAVVLQMCGEVRRARSMLLAALEGRDNHGTTYHARILLSLCYLHWFAGDFSNLTSVAESNVRLGEEFGLPESLLLGYFFLGVAHYERDELDGAREWLSKAVADRTRASLHDYSQCVFALATTHLAEGKLEASRELVDPLVLAGTRAQISTLLRSAQGFQAEIALHEGHLAAARRWADSFEPELRYEAYKFYVPESTWVKVLLAGGEADDLRRAGEFLEELSAFYASCRNTVLLARWLALKAAVHEVEGAEISASEALLSALELTRPGRIVRVFTDAGPSLIPVLERLNLNGDARNHAGRVLVSLRGRPRDGGPMELPTAED